MGVGLEDAQFDARGNFGFYAHRPTTRFFALVNSGRRPTITWRVVAWATCCLEETTHGNGRLSTAANEVAGSCLATRDLGGFRKNLQSIQGAFIVRRDRSLLDSR